MDALKVTKKRLKSMFGIREPFPNEWLSDAGKSLEKTMGAILQVNSKDCKALAGDALLAKGVGAGTVAGFTGLVGTFGAAGTGIEIAALFGAAKSTATLYWIGGLVGGGVAAGGSVLVAVAVLTGWGGLRLWKGKEKQFPQLEENEARILLAMRPILPAIHDAQSQIEPLQDGDLLALKAWGDEFLKSMLEYKSNSNLNLKHRIRLLSAIKGIKRFNERLSQWIK